MISAVILAAGESKRMGQPKMLLPWGKVTVLGQVISTYQAAGVQDVLVVPGLPGSGPLLRHLLQQRRTS